jgi:hypothetical protein
LIFVERRSRVLEFDFVFPWLPIFFAQLNGHDHAIAQTSWHERTDLLDFIPDFELSHDVPNIRSTQAKAIGVRPT